MYSICIVTHNQLNHLYNLLKQLTPIKEKYKDNLEIIVIDTNSQDGTREFIRGFLKKKKDFLRYEKIESDRYQIGMNYAVKLAKFPEVICMDADIEVPQDLIERFQFSYALASEFTKDKFGPVAAIIASGVGYVGNPAQTSLKKGWEEIDINDLQRNCEPRVQEIMLAASYCFYVKKNVFEKLGGFDTQFSYHFNDNDLFIRMWQSGYSVYLTRYLIVKHKTRNSHINCEDGIKYLKKHIPQNSDRNIFFIQSHNRKKLLEKTLNNALKYADEIVVIDNESKDGSKELIEEYSRKYNKIKLVNWDKKINFREIFQWEIDYSLECNIPWRFCLDDDEIMLGNEDSFRKVLRTALPSQLVHAFPWMVFHSDFIIQFKFDEIAYRGSRVFPNNYVFGPDNEVQVHSIQHPLQRILNGIFASNHSIAHFWAYNKEEVKRKYEFYKNIDPNPNYVFLGTDSYEKIFFSVKPCKIYINDLEEDHSVGLLLLAGKENFEEFIRFILRGYYTLFDQVVLVDTSLQPFDELFQISQLLEFEYIHSPLEQDFSKCRNDGLKLIRTRWVMYMDPDEHYENILNLSKIIRLCPADAMLIEFLNLKWDGKAIPSSTVRIWKHHPEIKFYGKVHECVDDSLKELKYTLCDCPIKGINLGLMDKEEYIRNKELYIKVTQEELKKDPTNYRAWYNYAVQLLEQGNAQEALKALDNCEKYAKGNVNVYYWEQRGLAYLALAKESIRKAIKDAERGRHIITRSLRQLLEKLESATEVKLHQRGEEDATKPPSS
ncbi:MAG: glycosyltransferase [Candidatus Helarchaeota archaeon]